MPHRRTTRVKERRKGKYGAYHCPHSIHARLEPFSSTYSWFLSSTRSLSRQDLTRIRSWAAQILDGLTYLNTHGIAHRTLTLTNVLLNPDGLIKLSNYGLHFMTKGGALVQFSIGDPHYLSPNTLGQQHITSLQDYSVSARCARLSVR